MFKIFYEYKMAIKQRDHSMDVLRGIAIFFVIFGHITHIFDIRTYIWGFHMPLFFGCLGIFSIRIDMLIQKTSLSQE